MSPGFRTTRAVARHRLTPLWSTADIPPPPPSPPSPPDEGEVLTAAWLAAVAANSGTLTANSETIISALASALSDLSCYEHILYMAPLCGGNLAAAVVPLIDRPGIGLMANVGLPAGSYAEATGVTGTGDGRFDLTCYPGEIVSTYGGIGLWYGMRAFSGLSPNIPFAAYHSSGNASTGLFLYPDSENFFSYGATPRAAGRGTYRATASSAGDYYGQDASPSSALGFYKNGSALTGLSTASLARYDYQELKLGLMGCSNGSGSWYSQDRCGCAMITDGHLSAAQIAEIAAALNGYLYTPTGR